MSVKNNGIFGDNAYITGVEEVSILDVLRKKEDKLRQAQELHKKENEEYQAVNDKYSELLAEHQKMCEKFNNEWEPKFADYTKETKEIKSRYRRLRRELRNAE